MTVPRPLSIAFRYLGHGLRAVATTVVRPAVQAYLSRHLPEIVLGAACLIGLLSLGLAGTLAFCHGGPS